MLGRLIGETIELKVSLGERPAWVFADPGMLEQVILNLCVNARDAMTEGGQLHIRTSDFRADEDFCRIHGWENPGDYMLVTVSDTGAGMSAEVRSRVFEPFFTTKEAGKGTGLGLSIVYGIVKQHQGVINVYSEVGMGTTFSFYLPSSQGQPEDAGDGEGIAQDHAGGTETVLVAEDEEGVRSLVAEVLESNGYKVITARNGQEALEIFKEKQDEIDLVLLDVIMPEMGGRATYEAIRALKPRVPVIFTTGYAADSIDGEFLAEHQVPLIRKPYQPGELYETVRETLDNAGLSSPKGDDPA